MVLWSWRTADINECPQIAIAFSCSSLRAVHAPTPLALKSLTEDDPAIKSAVAQFSAEVRDNAILMAEHYKLFYMLENDIRRLIDDTLSGTPR